MAKVLVISASMGGGHDGAGRELVRRVEAMGGEARMVDFLDAFPLRIGRMIRDSYELELRFAPWTYDLEYRICGVAPIVYNPILLVSQWLTSGQLRQWIDDVEPDVIVTTYPLTSLVLGRQRRKGRVAVPTVTFVTDFAVHSLWVHKGNDLALCVAPSSAESAARRTGRPARAPGPLVGDAFRTPARSKLAARRHLGLPDFGPLALVVAGSWGVGPLEATVCELSASGAVRPVVVCGRNEKVREALEERTEALVLGWTDQMADLMQACDVLVENAGGLTCMEAFAAGLPVLTYRPIPGHGPDNARRMATAGVTRYVTATDDLAPALEAVLGAEGTAMAARAQALFAGDAAADIVRVALDGSAEALPEGVASLSRRRHRKAGAPERGHRWRRRALSTVASVVVTYGVLTGGAEVATAHGFGVEHPSHAGPSAYVAIHLSDDALASPDVEAALAGARVTVVLDRHQLDTQQLAVAALVSQHIDIASAGSAERDWNSVERADDDLAETAGAFRKAGVTEHQFVDDRRINAFDLVSARVAHQEVVVPDVVVRGAEPVPQLVPGRVYLFQERHLTPAQAVFELQALSGASATAGVPLSPLAEF